MRRINGYVAQLDIVEDLGSGAFLAPGSESGMGKNPDPVSGMNIPDQLSECLETFFGLKTLKFFNTDPGSFIPWIRDPE
jgi:hypothetical protein